MESTLRKITSEPSILIIILASLVLFKTTFEKEIGTEIVTIYLTMAVLALAVYFLKREGTIQTELRQVPGNTPKSLAYAGGALVGFTLLYQVVNSLFRQSILPIQATTEQLSQSVFQSAFGGLVKLAAVDFSQLTL